MTGTTGFFFFEGTAAVAAAATVIAEKLKCTQCFFSPASFSHASFVMRTICCRYLRIACSLSLFLFSFYSSLSLVLSFFLTHTLFFSFFLSPFFIHIHTYSLSLSFTHCIFFSARLFFSFMFFLESGGAPSLAASRRPPGIEFSTRRRREMESNERDSRK